MPSSTVQTMPGPSRIPASTATVGGPHPQHTLSHSNSSFSLRNFVAEEDGFSAGMLKSVDKDAFLAAQRQALAAFDDAALAKALQASEETAAEEARKRRVATAVAPPSDERTPLNIIPQPSAPIRVPVQHQNESRYITDEEAARSLARSWRVDALQPALLDSSAIAAVSIPASSFNHAQSPSASASAFVTPHVSISTSAPRENSRNYNGDSSSRLLRAPSTAKPPQSYPSSSKVRVEDMAPQGRSAAVEGYKAERSGSVAGPSTPSSSPPSMSPSTSPPSRTHSRQPSGGTGAMASSSSRRARTPSVSATPPPDPSSSAHVNQNQSGQDTHGMTPSIISHSPSPSATTTKSRPIEKKVSASARDLRLGLTMTPTPLITPTTRPATRSRAQNISPEHEPSHHRDFFTASRRCSRCREVIKSPRSSVCFFFR